MSVIIRLQNLPWSANAHDIREFFQGLSIPEGGVHIVGGELGDAFIAFGSDEDARLAMRKSGSALKGIQISLLLSSRSEMQKVIETARQQAIGLQTYVAPAAATPVQMQAVQGFQQPSAAASGIQMQSLRPSADSNHMHQSQIPQQNAFNQMNYGNQMPPFVQDRGPLGSYPMGVLPQQMMPNQFYSEQSMVPPMGGPVVGQMKAPENVTSTVPNAAATVGLPSEPISAVAEKTKQETSTKDNKRENKSRDDRRRRSKSRSRDRDRDRDRRRRHRSRSSSRSRDRNSRYRRSRDRDRKDKDKSRDKEKNKTTQNMSNKEKPEKAPQEEVKVAKSGVEGGIPGLGEIPTDIPKEGLSIFAVGNAQSQSTGPITSSGDWPQREVRIESTEIQDVVMEDAPNIKAAAESSFRGSGRMGATNNLMMGPNFAGNFQKLQMQEGRMQMPDGRNQMPDGRNQMPDGRNQMPDGRIQMPDGRIQMPDGRIQMPDGKIKMPDGRMQMSDGRIQMPDGRMVMPDGRLKMDERGPPKEWTNHEIEAKRPRDPHPRDNQPDQRASMNRADWNDAGMSRGEGWPRKGGVRTNDWRGGERRLPTGVARNEERTTDDRNRPPLIPSKRPILGNSPNSPNFTREEERDKKPTWMPGGDYKEDYFSNNNMRTPSFAENDTAGGFRGGRRGAGIMPLDDSIGGPPFRDMRDRYDSDVYRGRGRGGYQRGGRMNTPDYGPKGENRSCCVEILNLGPSLKYKAIKNYFVGAGLMVPSGSIKLIGDKEGNPIGVALLKFSSPRDAFEATKLSGTYLFRSQLEINVIDEGLYDEMKDLNESQNNYSQNSPSHIISLCLYLRGLPVGCTDHDVAKLFSDVKVNEIVLELEKGSRQPTGGCYVLLDSLHEASYSLAKLRHADIDGVRFSVRFCHKAEMDNAMKDRDRAKSTKPVSHRGMDETRTGSSRGLLPNPNDRSLDGGQKDSLMGAELLTDSVVIKNVSSDITEISIRDFFSDEGLIPEKIYFNRPDSEGKCDVFAIFPKIENAARSLKKSRQHLGDCQVTVELIAKPAVMASMGLPFNPNELFLKGVKGATEPEQGPRDDQDFYGSSRDEDSSRKYASRRPRESRPKYSSNRDDPPAPDPPSDFGSPGCVVALTNVPYLASTEEIIAFFKDYPEVTPENIIRRYDEKNRPTADARVSLSSRGNASRAVETLNRKFMLNRPVYVSLVT